MIAVCYSLLKYNIFRIINNCMVYDYVKTSFWGEPFVASFHLLTLNMYQVSRLPAVTTL